MTNLGLALETAAETDPEAEAIVTPDQRWSYGQWADEVRRLAAGLQGVGVVPGSTVALLLPVDTDVMTTFFALSRLGCTTVPVNTRLKDDEILYLFTDCRPETILVSGSVEPEIGLVAKVVRAVADRSRATRDRPLVADLDRGDRARDVRPAWVLTRRAIDEAADDGPTRSTGDGRLILYTSGTTAKPKGVCLDEPPLVRKAEAWAKVMLELRPGDRLWNPLPFFHIGGISILLGALISRTTYLTDSHFEPGAALSLIEQERATVLWPGFSTILADLLHSPRLAETDLSTVRTVGVVGPPEALSGFQRAFPASTVVTCYGLTESGGIATVTSPGDDEHTRLRTVGRPLPGLEVKIDTSHSTTLLEDGQEAGEILISGYSLCQGYSENEPATAALQAGEGWIRTGDLGWTDGNGTLHLAGRLKDIIKVGGENVAAAEIEAVLSTHDRVAVAQVVADRDGRLVEIPVAFVELTKGPEVSEEVLRDLCRSRLARFKVPRRIVFVKQWPMSATKIQKSSLQRWLVDGTSDDGLVIA